MGVPEFDLTTSRSGIPSTTTASLLQSLSVSSLSAISSSGSTSQSPPVGLVKVPTAEGVAVKMARKVPGVASMVTPPAPASHVSSSPTLIEQVIVPVMPVVISTVTAP